MVLDKTLSKNFTLYELLESQQARRYVFTEQYEPSKAITANLEALCKNILQPLRDQLKIPITISSGYRCPRLNSIIGGAPKSQHLFGQAADIQCFKLGNENLLKRIAEMKLPFDQMINEFNFAWVHVSYDASRTRGQILEAYKNRDGVTKYRSVEV